MLIVNQTIKGVETLSIFWSENYLYYLLESITESNMMKSLYRANTKFKSEASKIVARISKFHILKDSVIETKKWWKLSYFLRASVYSALYVEVKQWKTSFAFNEWK